MPWTTAPNPVLELAGSLGFKGRNGERKFVENNKKIDAQMSNFEQTAERRADNFLIRCWWYTYDAGAKRFRGRHRV